MTHMTNNGITTEYPMASQNRYNRDNRDTSVEYNFEPLSTEYLTYLTEEGLIASRFYHLFKDFESTQIDVQDIKYIDYLQYLTDNHVIQNDRELFSHIIESLEYLVSKNLLHLDKKNLYDKNLNEIYYSKNIKHKTDDVQQKYIKVDYSKYNKSNDCRENYSCQLLNELHEQGGEIYLNNNNKFYFKLKGNDELIERPKKTVETILSKHFRFKIKITDDVLKYYDIDIDDFIFQSTSYKVDNTNLIGGSND